MANFDNGLPPATTDMADKCISEVVMQIDSDITSSQQGVQTIFFNSDQPDNQPGSGVKSVVFSTEPTGKNLVLFYL